MKNQTVFKRTEVKYLITKKQRDLILHSMKDFMLPDQYGKSTICNIYFDTADSLLIRRSLENQTYKEKLRLRSYGVATPTSRVFAELKKKYLAVVYKRRIALEEEEAMRYFCGGSLPIKSTQISREMDYFLEIYQDLAPKVFLSYQREAYYAKQNHHFRVTFDQSILWRDYDLSLCSGAYGDPILEEDEVLMEIKTSDAIPLWMVGILSENKIYKTSFSKYGNAYKQTLQTLQIMKGA